MAVTWGASHFFCTVASELVGGFSLCPLCQVARADALKGHSMLAIGGGRILVEILQLPAAEARDAEGIYIYSGTSVKGNSKMQPPLLTGHHYSTPFNIPCIDPHVGQLTVVQMPKAPGADLSLPPPLARN